MWKTAEYIWMEFVHWVKFWFFWLSSVHASSRIKEKLHQFRLEPIKFMITSNGNTRTNRANEKVIYFETRWSTIDFNVSIVSCLILMIYQKMPLMSRKKKRKSKRMNVKRRIYNLVIFFNYYLKSFKIDFFGDTQIWQHHHDWNNARVLKSFYLESCQ